MSSVLKRLVVAAAIESHECIHSCSHFSPGHIYGPHRCSTLSMVGALYLLS